MRIVKTIFETVHIIEPKVYTDNRGFFFESYQKERLQQLGICSDFVQDNISFSKNIGTIRGMHFQTLPNPQIKLIRVLRGSIENFFVDIRKDSPTYKKFDSVILSAANKLLLYLPIGFANGFKTIENDCEIQYKVDRYYAPESDRAFAYNDSGIGINWDVANPILSEKDSNAIVFSEIDNPFIFGENS